VENFYESASLLNDIRDYSISKKSIDPRAQIEGGAFQSLLGNAKQTDDDHDVTWSSVIGRSVFNVTVKEYAEFDVSWSITAKVIDAFGDCTAIRVAPFVNDQILWSAADMAEKRHRLPGTQWVAAPVPTDSPHPAVFDGTSLGGAHQFETLAGSGIISVANGSFSIGLVASPSMTNGYSQYFMDRWFFNEPKIVLRRVSR
tara:strand:- start:743 stop:1342 length:600 start_codon:yes stop_codon:yes gene_type:complete